MARKGFETVLTVTLRKPDSAEYRRFSDDVKARAKREYNVTIDEDDEVVHINQSINQSINLSICLSVFAMNMRLRQVNRSRVNIRLPEILWPGPSRGCGRRRRFRIDTEVRCVEAHPPFWTLSRRGLNPIKPAYDPDRPDGRLN